MGVEVEASVVTLPSTSLRVAPATTSSGEALQALLAFSALHQQIRQRRAHAEHDPAASSAADAWQLEHFVLDEVLQLVAERALAITGADGVAIALAEGDAIVCRALAGKVTPDVGARLDPNLGFSGACLTSGQVVRCDDSETDSRVHAETCRTLGTRSMVAVPLSAKQTIIGLVEAFSSEPYGFNDCDVRSLSLLAELILAALRPEEEDRLAEISQRVVAQAAVAESTAVTESTAQQDEQDRVEADPPEPGQEQEHIEQAATQLQEAKLSAELEEAAVMLPAAAAPETDAVPEFEAVSDSRPGLAVVIALIVVAVALAMGLWWNIRRHTLPVASTPKTIAPVQTNSAPAAQTPTSSPTAAAPIAESAEPEQEEVAQASPSAAASGQRPEVTGIRHWSGAGSSTVVIDLEDQVQYEAHRLSHPERIYLDLHDTRLVASLFNKTIDVGDPLLQRVRVAQPTHGVTRVVLETTGASNFSVSLEPNPYRLVIEVRTIGAEPKPRAKVELFGPIEQAAQPPPVLAKSAINGAPTLNGAPSPLPPLLDGKKLQAGEPKLRIVLDAGHGGWDLGTVGRKGLLEKDLVLDIVERLGKLVEKRLAAAVIYTRTDDNYIALEKRAEVANVAKADLFVSVHANYSDFPSARGVETYYTNTYSSVRARTHDSGDADTSPDGLDEC